MAAKHGLPWMQVASSRRRELKRLGSGHIVGSSLSPPHGGVS